MFKIFDCSLLFAALASFLASVGLWFLVKHDYGVYVALWVPGILALWVGLPLVVTSEHLAISRKSGPEPLPLSYFLLGCAINGIVLPGVQPAADWAKDDFSGPLRKW